MSDDISMSMMILTGAAEVVPTGPSGASITIAAAGAAKNVGVTIAKTIQSDKNLFRLVFIMIPTFLYFQNRFIIDILS
jgi:hypothetical protein